MTHRRRPPSLFLAGCDFLLSLDVRQYSCYCRWCSLTKYHKCDRLDVVRHQPHNPPTHFGYQKWRDEGWRAQAIGLHKPPPGGRRAWDRRIDLKSFGTPMEFLELPPKFLRTSESLRATIGFLFFAVPLMILLHLFRTSSSLIAGSSKTFFAT